MSALPQDSDLSPSGLHGVEPGPDFSAQYVEQEIRKQPDLTPDEKVKAVALAVLARNKGSVRKTAMELGLPQRRITKWKQESAGLGDIGNPFLQPAPQRVRLSSSSDLEHSQKKLVQVINTIVDGLPKMLSKATLTEQVKTLNQLVSIKGEIDDLLAPPTPTGMTADELKDMAKKKLELKKRNADEPA